MIDIRDLLMPVGQICQGAPSTTLIKAYVDAARQFCSMTRWLRATAPGLCEIGTHRYAIGNDPYNEVIGITAVSRTLVDGTKTDPLTQGNTSRWNQNQENGDPRLYAYLPEATLAIYPTPDQAYTLSIGLVIQPKRGVVALDEALCTQWEYALRRGALAYLLTLPGKWTDKNEAMRQQLLFNADMNAACSSVARGYNSGVEDTDVDAARNSRPRSRVLAI